MRSPLLDRTHRRLFIAQATDLSGTGLSTVALALLAYEMVGGNASTVLGTALALKMAAYVSIAPIVGAFATEHEHKHTHDPVTMNFGVKSAREG
jgi:hypothetical protein